MNGEDTHLSGEIGSEGMSGALGAMGAPRTDGDSFSERPADAS